MDALPPKLGRQQRFVLAWLALAATTHRDPPPDSTDLSWAVATEFDTETRNRIDNDHPTNDRLTRTHRASLARTLAALEDRGLLLRPTRPASPRPLPELTANGREIGHELLNRHRDKRYSLRFRTIE